MRTLKLIVADTTVCSCHLLLLFCACSNWDGMYVLYTYAAKRQTARNVQLLLSNPEAGSEDKILRHITLCRL
jgi:hypothetical protein